MAALRACGTLARIVGQRMTERCGQPALEDRAGAVGNLAAELVARAAPDGHAPMLHDGFEEVCRVLKPDGRFLIWSPLNSSFSCVARPKRDRRSLGAPGNGSRT